MIDQASFWLGVLAGFFAFLGVGLAAGAFTVSVSSDGDVRVDRDNDAE